MQAAQAIWAKLPAGRGQSSVMSKMIKRLGEIGPQILDMLDPD